MHRYLIATGLAVLALVAIAGTPFALTPPSPVPAERPDALAHAKPASMLSTNSVLPTDSNRGALPQKPHPSFSKIP